MEPHGFSFFTAVKISTTAIAINEGFRYAIIASDEKKLRLKDRFSFEVMDYKPMDIKTICAILENVRNPYHVVNIGYREELFGWLDSKRPKVF